MVALQQVGLSTLHEALLVDGIGCCAPQATASDKRRTSSCSGAVQQHMTARYEEGPAQQSSLHTLSFLVCAYIG